MTNFCSITGKRIQGAGDAIWDEGEWVSWDYINQQLRGPQPNGGLLEDLIRVAIDYHDDTGRFLPIYGEIGEHYASRRFGIELHDDPKAQGSDGQLGGALVEIKTISPMRDSRDVRVKCTGDYTYLVIVKIDTDHRIDAKLISRKFLGKPCGKFYIVGWDDHRSEHPNAG